MATDRRGVIVPLVILAWLFLTPEPARLPATRADGRLLIDDAIAQEQFSLSVLQNSTWNPSFGRAGSTLNLTGLQPGTEFAWESLPAVKKRAGEHLEYSLGPRGSSALKAETEEPNPIPFYTNVTGYVQGKWRRSKLQHTIPIPHLNLTEYARPGPFGQPGRPRLFDRNITGSDGHVTIRFSEKDTIESFTLAESGSNNMTEMKVDLKVTDGTTYEEFEIQMHGVYFVDLGQAILTTTSDKFSGIFALPHLALSEPMFEASRKLLNHSITNTIQRQVDRKTDSLNPWTARTESSQNAQFATPECDLVVYLQQMASTTSADYSSALMSFVERELRFPTGAVLPHAPDLHFSMLAFSPDCGYTLESQGPPEDFAQDGDHLLGPKMEVQFLHSRQHLMIFTIVLASQLFLLMRQMREANTPSTRSRISFYTIAILALGDGFTTMTFLLVSLFISGLWINLVGTGFLAFISVSFFGMRFLMDIWQVQAPERERTARAEVEEERRRDDAFDAALQRLRAERNASLLENTANATETPQSATQQNITSIAAGTTPAVAPPPARSAPGSLPLPVPATARPPTDTGATPVFMPSDQEGLEPIGQPTAQNPLDMNAAVQARMPSFASLYTRFYLLLLGTLFLSLNATSWPAAAQRIYFTLLGLLYLSFWVPQILRNVHRNCRHALNWEFVFGQSTLRLVPFAYLYGYSNNVLFTAIDYYGLATLAVWVWIQVVVLVSQELIGPRWFVRKDWAPPAYDYHPVLRDDEEGNTMPIGFSQAQVDASTPSSPTQERTPPSPLTSRRASIAKESRQKGKRIFDCAICMQDLEVPVIEAGASADAGLAGGLLTRRTYMVTPCRHIFHSACLEGWMKYRLQCPICRETLPPL